MPENIEDKYANDLEGHHVKRNFARWAVNYLGSAGLSPDQVDIPAYYDTNLSYRENQELFKQQFPLPKGDLSRDELKAQMEDFYNQKHKAIEAQQEQERGTVVGKAKEFVSGVKEKYHKYQQKKEIERAIDIENRINKLKARQDMRQRERDLQLMERKARDLEGNVFSMAGAAAQGVASMLRGMGNTARGTGRAQGGRFDLRGSSMLHRGVGGGGSLLGAALMGNITQSRQRKPRYITVVQGNKIFRINTSEHQDTQQPMPTQPQPQQSSVLGSMLMGGSGGSGMLLQAATQQHGRVMRTAGNSSGKLRAIMLGTNSKKKGWWG